MYLGQGRGLNKKGKKAEHKCVMLSPVEVSVAIFLDVRLLERNGIHTELWLFEIRNWGLIGTT